MKALFWLLTVAGGLLATGYLYGFGVSSSLDGGQAYQADLEMSAGLDLAELQSRAQALGWWVRIQNDFEVAYFQGADACKDCDSTVEDQFFTLPQLIVDSGFFALRLDTEAFRVNVRPKTDASGAYEAVVVMKNTLSSELVIQRLDEELTRLGLDVGANLAFAALPLNTKSKTPVPDGLALEETLFRLLQAPDWYDFAALQGLSLSGLRVRAVVELADAQTQPGNVNLLLEQSASDSFRAQVLIPQLLTLARDPAVQRVRLPLQPQAGRS